MAQHRRKPSCQLAAQRSIAWQRGVAQRSVADLLSRAAHRPTWYSLTGMEKRKTDSRLLILPCRICEWDEPMPSQWAAQQADVPAGELYDALAVPVRQEA